MDGSWNLPIVSTIYSAGDEQSFKQFYDEVPYLRPPPKDTEKSLICDVRLLTASLRKNRHYCPNTWLKRALVLLRLGYPELAAGDTFKAVRLLQEWELSPTSLWAIAVSGELARCAQLSKIQGMTETTPGRRLTQRSEILAYAKSLKGRVLLALAQALFLANCFVECIEMIKEHFGNNLWQPGIERISKLAIAAQRKEDTDRLRDGVSVVTVKEQEARASGAITPRVYPWMSPVYIGRTNSAISAARASLDQSSGGRCTLKCSDIRDRAPNNGLVEKESQVFGIFANADLAEDEICLIDCTPISGVDNEDQRCSCCHGYHSTLLFKLDCCSANFCSQKCLDQAVQFYHPPMCKVASFETILDKNHAAYSPERLTSLKVLYRVLACAEERAYLHPLRNPVLHRMTPAYSEDTQQLFSFESDIKLPFRMLDHLGVDIYRDHGFDTWVVQAIQARLQNNCRDYRDDLGQYHCVANLSYQFFNHSCRPNVWIRSPSNGSSMLTATTSEAVRKGEELFINYLEEDDLELSYEDRQEKLKQWTGGQCQCSRCREERELATLHRPRTNICDGQMEDDLLVYFDCDDENDEEYCDDDDYDDDDELE